MIQERPETVAKVNLTKCSKKIAMFPEEIIRKFEFIIYYGYSIGPPMTQDPEYRAIAEWLKKCVIDRNCRIEILP